MVANRAKNRAITTPIPSPRTSTPSVTPPVGDAERSKIGPHQNTAVQKNAIKNTTSNTGLARSAKTADQTDQADQNADRPQRAGAGVAEWG